MRKCLVLLLLAALLAAAATGCRTNQGAREYLPGRGWVPTR